MRLEALPVAYGFARICNATSLAGGFLFCTLIKQMLPVITGRLSDVRGFQEKNLDMFLSVSETIRGRRQPLTATQHWDRAQSAQAFLLF